MIVSEDGKPRRISFRVSGDDDAHAKLQDILSLTGQVTFAWAGLEQDLVLVLCFLSGATYPASEIIYYSPSSFSGRLAIIKNLVQHEMPEGPERALLERALDRIQRLSKARNAFIHSAVAMNIGAVRTPYLTRTVWQPHRPERKETYRTGPADLEAHLVKLGCLRQLRYFLSQWQSDVKTVRHWARLAVNTT